MTVTFFGHGDVEYSIETEQKIAQTVERLINNGADYFLLGGYGNFDTLCAKIVKKLQAKYPQIKSTLVVPYLNREYNLDLYDDSVYPPLENTPLRFAIVKRNQWMIDNSQLIVAYVKYSWGGATKAVTYAKKKNKQIINLCNIGD